MAFARWDRELAWAVGLLLLACNGDGTSPPGPPTDLAKSGGDGQSWYFNNPLPVSLSVIALDPSGRPVPGVVVTWAATSGGVRPAQSTTNANGVATTIDSLGSSTLQTVSASFTGLSNAATFTEIGSAPSTAVGVSVSNNLFAPRDTAVQSGGAGGGGGGPGAGGGKGRGGEKGRNSGGAGHLKKKKKKKKESR